MFWGLVSGLRISRLDEGNSSLDWEPPFWAERPLVRAGASHLGGWASSLGSVWAGSLSSGLEVSRLDWILSSVLGHPVWDGPPVRTGASRLGGEVSRLGGRRASCLDWRPSVWAWPPAWTEGLLSGLGTCYLGWTSPVLAGTSHLGRGLLSGLGLPFWVGASRLGWCLWSGLVPLVRAGAFYLEGGPPVGIGGLPPWPRASHLSTGPPVWAEV